MLVGCFCHNLGVNDDEIGPGDLNRFFCGGGGEGGVMATHNNSISMTHFNVKYLNVSKTLSSRQL